jgi:hypothetical protein
VTIAQKRYSRDYPPENTDKYLARRSVYEVAKDAPRWTNAVTFSGPEEATESTEMKFGLQWPLERVWFVDHSESKALRAIKWAHPETNVFNGDLVELAPKIGPIGFAYLDFMGTFKTAEQQCYQAVCKQLPVGGVIALTCYRGREVKQHVVGSKILALGNGMDWSDRRWIVVCQLVRDLALEVGKTLTLTKAVQYQHGVSPLCVSVWKCVDPTATLPAVCEEQLTLAQAAREHMQHTLRAVGGNISEAARRLGVRRQSLQRKLRR